MVILKKCALFRYCFILRERNSYYANWWNNISKEDKIRSLNNDNNVTIFKTVDTIFRDIL